MGKNKKGSGRMKKIYMGAGRLNPIWEQGALKWQKLKGSGKKGAGRIIKIKEGAGRQDPPLGRLSNCTKARLLDMRGISCKSIIPGADQIYKRWKPGCWG